MAQQLLYMSARSGLENRAGFQFVATSRDAVALRPTVAPYLAYRPPPSAPAQPTAAELENLPVSLSYQREGDHLVLVQCRYLGTDYSGRYGNFLGHAVVARTHELGGLRPIELWQSSLWTRSADDPAQAELPELTDLPPGPHIEPEAILSWLANAGEPAYRLLAALVDAVLARLDRRGGQVILVSNHVDTVARWIAAVSYSMPHEDTLDLSFVTYTADPDRARHHLVGTTPDAMAGLRSDAHVFEVDRGSHATVHAGVSAGHAPSRYAEAIATGWRRGSFENLDELLELLAVTGSRDQHGRDAAATLIALCHGLAGIDRDADAAAVAGLVDAHAERLPDSVWGGLAQQTGAQLGDVVGAALYGAAQRTGRSDMADQMGAELVGLALGMRRHPAPAVRRLSAARRESLARRAGQALREAADLDELVRILGIARDQNLAVDPTDLRDGTAAAVRSGAGDLATAHDMLKSPEQRQALLDGAVDGLAAADGTRLRAVLTPVMCDRLVDRDWSDAPWVGAYVLTSYGRHRPAQRVAMTEALVDLADRGGLSDGDLDRYVGHLWEKSRPSVNDCLTLMDADGLLAPSSRSRPCIVALARAALATADVRGGGTATLAKIVLGTLDSADPAAADAEAVIALREMVSGEVAVGCERFERARTHASKDVVKDVSTQAHGFLLTAPPHQQAAALLRLSADSALRRSLVTELVRRRGGDVDLAEVAVRLMLDGAPDERLTAEVAARTRDQFDALDLQNELRERGRELARGFDKLRASAKPTRSWSPFKRGGDGS